MICVMARQGNRAAALLALILVAAIMGRAAADTVLRIGVLGVPPTKGQPYASMNAPTIYTWAAVFDSLTFVGHDGQVRPWLATSWRNLDPLTWEFSLRQGVTFSNGEPFTADAVVYAVGYLTSAEAQGDVVATMLNSLDRAWAVGDETVIIKTKTPNPMLPREAATLRVQNPVRDTGEFQSVRNRLGGMSPALTAEQVAKGQGQGGQTRPVGTGGGRTVQVQAPSGQYRTHNAGNFLQIAVPSNWQPVSGQETVTYAPEGAYFQGNNGGSAFTHGVEVGVAPGTGNLQRDTQSFLQSLSQSNPEIRVAANARRENLGGRAGLTTQLANTSEVTGQREYVALSTTSLRDGSILYVIGVAPQPEANTYENTFRRVRQNLRITD